MTIGERIRVIRKSAKMNLDDFGEKVGVTGPAVSMMENGKASVTDRSIKAICREFHVNEEWLRDGIGEPHSALTRTEEIERIVTAAMKSEPETLICRLISALSKLDESDWEALGKVWDKITGHAPTPAAPPKSKPPSREQEAERVGESIKDEIRNGGEKVPESGTPPAGAGTA